jgi:hypothetical protein
MSPTNRIVWWCEWKSWALPIRIGAMGDWALFEVQIGPFGLTVHRRSSASEGGE